MNIADIQIGVDIVEVERLKDVIDRGSNLERIFTPSEIEYCNGKQNPWTHFAGRFAGKESVVKAFTPYGIELTMMDIEILNTGDNYPMVTINDRRSAGFMVRITISHTDRNAMATAIVWKSEPDEIHSIR